MTTATPAAAPAAASTLLTSDAIAPQATDQHILNSSTCVMGLTGSGKSSLLATLIIWGYETFGAISFYYLYDGGGFPTQVQALINRGICRLWRVRTRSAEGLAPETIHRAAMGWWPQRIDPKTGVGAPAVKLIAPTTTIYTMRCPNGHEVRRSASQAALTPGPCPTCKVMVDRTNMQITPSTQRTKGFPEKRLVMYDGISAACSWLLDDLSHRTLGGEQSRLGSQVLSGDMVFGENNRAQVGFTQTSAERWVIASSAIPDLVVPPVWTALTKEGSDEASLTVVGPDLAGQAKIAVAGQWFGSTVEPLVTTRGGKTYRQLRTAQWMDEKSRRHLCRIGSYPGAVPAILEEEAQDDGAGAFTQFNLGLLHQLLQDARKATETQYVERYADAPGLPEGEVTYGEEPAVATAAAPTTTTTAGPATPRSGPPAGATLTKPGAVTAGTPVVSTPATIAAPATTAPPPVVAAVGTVTAPVAAQTPTSAHTAVAPKPPVAAARPAARPATPAGNVSQAPLPPATVGPPRLGTQVVVAAPKPPVAGPAMPPGRRPAAPVPVSEVKPT